MNNKIITLLLAAFIAVGATAQEVDLFKMLDEETRQEDKNRTDYTRATFKTTRIINGHSIENTPKGILDLKVSHRFGMLNQGAKDLWGFDNARMRFGFDYGITDKLMIGVGRSTFQKQYDGFLRYKLIRQSTGKRNMPVSVGFLSAMMIKTAAVPDDGINKNHFSNKLNYAFQLIIARKFSDNTSLQVMPTVVHHNRVPEGSRNDVAAIGLGGRQKISKRVSINAEYYYVLPKTRTVPLDSAIQYYNSLSIGFDIETGGHVFQLHFTNSTPMTESSFITETTGQWGLGDIHFGFNISRVFVIGGKKKNRTPKTN